MLIIHWMYVNDWKTTILNTYLNEIMDGLSAQVFRTYNASRTLQEQLDKMTNRMSFFI